MKDWTTTSEGEEDSGDNGKLDGTSGDEGDSGELSRADSGERIGAVNSGGSAMSNSVEPAAAGRPE